MNLDMIDTGGKIILVHRIDNRPFSRTLHAQQLTVTPSRSVSPTSKAHVIHLTVNTHHARITRSATYALLGLSVRRSPRPGGDFWRGPSRREGVPAERQRVVRAVSREGAPGRAAYSCIGDEKLETLTAEAGKTGLGMRREAVDDAKLLPETPEMDACHDSI